MATVYQRIANPWMPNGTPDKTNSPVNYGSTTTGGAPYEAPGEIGCAFNEQNTNRGWLRVILDSGATSATPTGAVAAGQLAFWKSRSGSIVTNDKRFADVGATGAVNRVAGIFALAVTPGYLCDVQIQGLAASVASDGTGVAGNYAVADTTASTARVTVAATGTAPPSQPIGVLTAAPSGGLVAVDVSLGVIV